jgi:hypothetical protein
MGSMPPNLDPDKPLPPAGARGLRGRTRRSALPFIFLRLVLLAAAIMSADALSGGVLRRELQEQAIPAIGVSLSSLTHRIATAVLP